MTHEVAVVSFSNRGRFDRAMLSANPVTRPLSLRVKVKARPSNLRGTVVVTDGEGTHPAGGSAREQYS